MYCSAVGWNLNKKSPESCTGAGGGEKILKTISPVVQLYCRARGEGVLINLTTRVVRLFCRAVSGKTLKTKITNAMQLYSSAENRKLA